MNIEIPSEVAEELKDLSLNPESEVLAKKISELSDSLKSEEMKIIESQQKKITQLQAKLDEANELLRECSLIFSGVSEMELEMNGWDRIDAKVYAFLNPPLEENK